MLSVLTAPPHPSLDHHATTLDSATRRCLAATAGVKSLSGSVVKGTYNTVAAVGHSVNPLRMFKEGGREANAPPNIEDLVDLVAPREDLLLLIPDEASLSRCLSSSSSSSSSSSISVPLSSFLLVPSLVLCA